MQTSIARFKNNSGENFEFSIEDIGIPRMFGEILSPMFNLMSLQKKASSIIPQTDLSDIFREMIFNKINDSNTFKSIKEVDWRS